jgi:predicted DsbA family dithiol-disulfide isomerase
MNTPLHIDFVSDIACPWCAVGLHALDEALRRIGKDIDISLRFQPYELNPDMPREGDDTVAYLSRKYGLDAERIAQNQANIRERGAAVGFRFGTRHRVWNTFDAHRLLHWAALVDAEAEALAATDHQARLKHALLQAYHGDGENPSDPEVLLRLAGDAGLDGEAAREVLASGAYADEVRAAEAQWQQAGIRAVPSVVINGRHLIQGGQPPEVFEQALRQIAAGVAAG